MKLPFSQSEFFDVFALYNESVWPAQLFLNALAVAAVVLAFRRTAGAGRGVNAILAFLWIWMGAVYHARFFVTINPAALAFAGLFIAQGLLFLWLAVARKIQYEPDAAGTVTIAVSLIVYPMLIELSGHHYPGQPTFGLPCPTTIFTFGFLLWGVRSIPKLIMVIPALWALVGTTAAFQLGIRADLLLSAAFVVFLIAGSGVIRAEKKYRHAV